MNSNRLNILLINAATALILTGCGGSGSEKAGGNSAATTAATANADAASRVPAAGSGANNVAPANGVASAPSQTAAGGATQQQQQQQAASAAGGARGASPAPSANMPKPQIGSGGNDFYLFTQARAALNADAELNAANLVVDVKQGVATLSGAVQSAEHKSKAEQLVRAAGLKTVKNQLRISNGK